ncbi:hypothetical protein SUGI_1357800 [Cryptomeria japonica]|uniref:GH16 domain-containing protein n=1 Tax=Cryptomeria japonica TaxID=3369 RepID=A0AAD3NTJ6_CRYJA|nr:hypothetical protein SUGI_1357720 [Cryptomeria japonica]GLJ57659.1 hypothetical protein SUGI_1357800 [Cryptomeria japonica]
MEQGGARSVRVSRGVGSSGYDVEDGGEGDDEDGLSVPNFLSLIGGATSFGVGSCWWVACCIGLPCSVLIVWRWDFVLGWMVSCGVELTLDRSSGSGFQSKKEYLFENIDMQIKLVPGNSAGTITTYYLSSQGNNHDEIHFEFLGNLSGDPYVMHTNVYSQGQGNREQQFNLWFDHTADFHTYSLLWNPQQIIIFSVDGTPVRVFENNKKLGVAYPKNQAMRIYSSSWYTDDWATRGGAMKTDWRKAPFDASFHNFNA